MLVIFRLPCRFLQNLSAALLGAYCAERLADSPGASEVSASIGRDPAVSVGTVTVGGSLLRGFGTSWDQIP